MSESAQVKLARATVESYVTKRRVPQLTEVPPEMQGRAGVFVSIHKGDDLRGCIGTIGPTEKDIAREIIQNAVSAATRDPRFPPITSDELEHLDIKVDVLHEPEPVEGVSQLDPECYGVIVSCDWRRGLLLPDLKGVDTCEQQVAIAKRKAGIGPQEHVRLDRFKVDRYD